MLADIWTTNIEKTGNFTDENVYKKKTIGRTVTIIDDSTENLVMNEIPQEFLKSVEYLFC